MSHIQAVNEARKNCDNANQCTEYQLLLQHEYDQIDKYTANAVQFTVTWGVVVVVIGLAVILSPFVKSLNKFQSFLLPKLAVAVPIVAGLVGGVFLGFAIAFSACYKQSCSPFESTAMFSIPLATLTITIPIARKIYQKRQLMATGVSQPKPLIWVITGLIIVLLATVSAINGVVENKKSGEQQKQYLLKSEI